MVGKKDGVSCRMLVLPPRELSEEELRAMKPFKVEPTFLGGKVSDQCTALDHSGLTADVLDNSILDIDCVFL